jgi:hypothetical protein
VQDQDVPEALGQRRHVLTQGALGDVSLDFQLSVTVAGNRISERRPGFVGFVEAQDCGTTPGLCELADRQR